MSITPDEAATALRDIADTDARSRALRGYRDGARQLLLWGVIWITGYGATGVWGQGRMIWPPLVVFGIIGSLVIGRRSTGVAGEPVPGRGLRALMPVILAAFIFSLDAVLHPQTPNQYAVVPPLAVALAYAMLGSWMRPRFLAIGAGLFALTLIGYFGLPALFPFWMAIVGGGALILSAVWWRVA